MTADLIVLNACIHTMDPARPREIVPSGKIPTASPAARASIAACIACVSPTPRSIGIWPMPRRIGASGLIFQSSALARARICRRRTAATPTITGSQWLSWLPMISSGPLSGTLSRPSTRSRPHQATGRLIAIAAR